MTDDEDDLLERRTQWPPKLGETLEERLGAMQPVDDPAPILRNPKPRKKRSDGKTSGGARRSQEAVRRDVEQVAHHIANGKPRWWILEYYAKKGVPRATVDRWIHHVRERMVGDLHDEMPIIREKLLAQMRKQREACIKEGDQTNARQYFKLEMELVGAAAPERHDVRAVVAQVAAPPPEPDFDARAKLEGASDEELAAVKALAQKLARREPAGLIGDTTVEDG